MNTFVVVGYIATVLAIGMYIPQTLSVIKSKKTGTLSKVTFPIILFGSLMWALYSGIEKQDIPANIPAYLTNVIIVGLMLPIVWYLFVDTKNNIIIFVSILLFSLLIMILSTIIMFDRDILLKNASSTVIEVLGYFFVSFAGICTGLPFIPQAFKIVKENRIGDISIVSSLLVILSNLMWVIFWTGHLLQAPKGFNYIPVIVSAAGLIVQLPIIYVYIKNIKK